MTTWGSTTPSLRSEIQKILDDATFETSGTYYDYLLPWANRIINEIANEIPIRALLTSSTATITAANYIWTMPTDYMMKDERFTKVRDDDEYIDIVGLEELNAYDPDHDETTTATPECCAIEGSYLYVYPMWAGDITIENYYRIPTAMSADASEPDIPNDNLRTDLIIAGVCGKYGFPAIKEEDKAKRYYNRSTNPKSGLFFDLLHEYRQHFKSSSDTVWRHRMKYY